MYSPWPRVTSPARQSAGLDGPMFPAAQIVCDLRKSLGVPCKETRASVARREPTETYGYPGTSGIFAFVLILNFTHLSFYRYDVLIIMTPLLECPEHSHWKWKCQAARGLHTLCYHRLRWFLPYLNLLKYQLFCLETRKSMSVFTQGQKEKWKTRSTRNKPAHECINSPEVMETSGGPRSHWLL